ncbi:MAG: hypothetical protein A2Y33_09715 [Spirochaetes bacterium GWF1_51_8]|nr:MAG: hypothetical protein A2Y33_09715 [Spirochaetes bacterium GWF1_51_8]
MADRGKKCPAPGNSTPAWMTTFGDMNSLLLTFFIAMLTSAEIEGRELRLIMSSYEGNIGFLQGGSTLAPGTIPDMGFMIESLPSREKGEKLSQAVKDVNKLLKPELKDKKVTIQETKKGLKLSLSSDVLFAPGSAEIDFEEGREILRKIAQLIKEIAGEGFKIEVIGHTDNTTIPPDSTLYAKFPSNWELSTFRACSVVRFFIDFGLDPSLLFAEGKSEYEPVFPNDTLEGRMYNRRIDIYITIEDSKS